MEEQSLKTKHPPHAIGSGHQVLVVWIPPGPEP